MYDEGMFRGGVAMVAVSVAAFIFLSNFVNILTAPIAAQGFAFMMRDFDQSPHIIYYIVIGQAVSAATAIIGVGFAIRGFKRD